MRRLRITVLDLTTERPTGALYARVMNANLASIMPQVIAVWCEQAGHNVRFVCYTGFEAILPGIESWFTLGNKARNVVRALSSERYDRRPCPSVMSRLS